jgi:hypothetical protein
MRRCPGVPSSHRATERSATEAQRAQSFFGLATEAQSPQRFFGLATEAQSAQSAQRELLGATDFGCRHRSNNS